MARYLGIVLAALISLACAAPAYAASGKLGNARELSFAKGVPVPAWVLPMPAIPATVREDVAVLRLADTQVRIGREVAMHMVRAIQANDQEALAAIGQFSIDYFPDYQSLQLHEVAILRDGRKLDQRGADTRLLDSERRIEQGMYGGAVTLQLLLRDVRVGDTLLVRYTIKGTNPVFDGHWFDDFNWDISIPTEHRRLVVMRPARRPLYWRQAGDFLITPVPHRTEMAGGDERLVFEERNIDAREWEPGTPPEYQPGRLLQFSEFADWGAVGAWAAALFPARPASPALTALARQFATEATPARRVAAALRWVQNEVRYFSVSIGENSHRPQPPEVVLKNRYGDCKDKAYLLASLLRLLDIDAVPVLVSAQAPLAPARLLPSPGAFDHAIVRLSLGENEYYVDPTRSGQTEALEALPVPLPGAAGLPAAPDAARLVTLPPRRDVVDFVIDESFALAAFDGPATLAARREYRGDYAAGMRRLFATMSAASLKKHVLELYEKQYPGVALSKPPALKEYGDRFELLAELTVPKPVKLVDGHYEFPVESRLVAGTLEIPDKLVRNYPFVPAAPLHGRHVQRIAWPAAARLNDVPGAFSIDNRYFAYRHDYLLRGNVLHYEADYRIKADRVAPADMQALHDAVRRLAEGQAASFMVGKASLVPEAMQRVSYRAAVSAVAAQAATLELRKVKQDADDDTLCVAAVTASLAGEYLPVGRSEAIGMLREELVRRRGRELAKRCVVTLDFMEGNLSGETRSALATMLDDPASSASHYQAWALLLSGDKAGALAAAERHFAALESAGTATVFDRQRHAALLLRAGARLPTELRASLASPVNTAWPAPIGRLLANGGDSDALLAEARMLAGAHRELALAEAWYYIGVLRLGAGDVAGARQAWRQVQATGIRNTFEYQLAGAELAALASRNADLLAGAEAERNDRLRAAVQHYQRCAANGDGECRFALGFMVYHGRGTARDHGKALELFRQAAAQEVAEAQNFVGVMYDAGEGVARDGAEAMRWFEKAAGNLDPHGLLNAGDRYLRGIDAGRDVQRGIDYLRLAAALGHEEAQDTLGLHLLSTSPEEAGLWNRVGAIRGVPAAQVRLINQMRMGEGMPADAQAAMAMARPLAEKGDPGAQVQLGMMYEYGTGVAKDRDAAMRWYRKVAASGVALGKLRVGLLLTEGDRTADEYREARLLLEQALDGEMHYAAMLLGALHRDGQGGPIDLERAAAYFEQADAAGVPGAAVSLGLLYHFKAGDPAKAAHWYGKGIGEGSGLAMNNLGDLYELGKGVPQDYGRAIDLYRQAARLEEPYGFLSLGMLYADGKGVPRDPMMGLTYLALAARFGKASERMEELQRQLTPAQVAAAREAAGQWTKEKPLPGA